MKTQNANGKHAGGRPPKYDDPEILQNRINQYFEMCDESRQILTDAKGRTVIYQKPYTISGLCLFLEISDETLNEYIKLDKFSYSLSHAKKKIEAYIVENSLTNQLQPQVAMFNLKNNFGWIDKQEIENTNVNLEIDVESYCKLSPEDKSKYIDDLTAAAKAGK